MGEFQPEAHLKGWLGCSLTALICNRKSAIFEAVVSTGMKQKYKVFINDHILEFLESAPAEIDTSHCYSDGFDPNTLVQKLSSTSGNGKNPAGKRFCIISDRPEQALKLFTGNFKLIRAAGGIVKRVGLEDEVLMIFRLGKWDLPKGKIEKDESLETSAVREVEEECGIGGLKIIRKLPETRHMYFHKDRWVLKETAWFEMTSGDHHELIPQIEEGITEVRWVNKKELPLLLQNSYSSIASLLEETVLNS